MPNVLIHPNSGIIEFNLSAAGSSTFYGLTGGIRMTYQNTGEINITSTHSGNNNRFSVDGSKGRLLDVSDSISGSLFSINDKAGLPILEVFDDDRVVMGEYNSNALTASGKYAGVGNQIRWSGQNGDPASTIAGSMWYSSKDKVFRVKNDLLNNSLALGKTFAVFKATDAYGPPASNATTGTRNSIRTLVFGDTTALSTTFVGIVPTGICLNSGIIARLFWTAATATSNNVLWSVSFENMWTDLDADSFDTATSGVSAAGTPAGALNTGVYSCTAIDSLRQGLPFRVRVTRSAADVLDNMTGNAELILLELQATL